MGPCVRRDDVSHCGGNRVMRSPLRLGVIAGIVTLVLDQASKYWLLYVFDIGRRGAVRVTPFFDLVLAWNIGISFGWFQNDSQIAQTSLMVVKAIAVIALSIWMARSQTVMARSRSGSSSAGRSATRSTGWPMARWLILPYSTCRSAQIPTIGMCLTLRTRRLLPGLWPYCMILL